VEADVFLEALGKALEDHVHVDAVGVGPGVLEALLEALAERVGDLVEADEFFDFKHLGLVAGGAAV